jgi:3-methyladenine DNA glycosylase AlkD
MRTELSTKKVERIRKHMDIKVSVKSKYEKDWNVIVERLVQALNDENKYVRWGAAGALGEMEDKRAVEPLMEALKDKDYDVQMKAAWALRKMGVL